MQPCLNWPFATRATLTACSHGGLAGIGRIPILLRCIRMSGNRVLMALAEDSVEPGNGILPRPGVANYSFPSTRARSMLSANQILGSGIARNCFLLPAVALQPPLIGPPIGRSKIEKSPGGCKAAMVSMPSVSQWS
jgi:hypothetical protein